MDLEKRRLKEKNIISAAEEVFGAVGFGNAKMDDIAKKASITKVTLYSYFQSKENLYMAVTYRAFQYLIEILYLAIEDYKMKSGLEGVIGILNSFIVFCENNFLYSEAILNYFSLIRSSRGGKDKDKISSGIYESIYFNKIRDIQNLPLILTSKEIKRGQKDSSIKSVVDPILLTLQGWSMIVGYTKLMSSSENNMILLSIDLKDLKELILKGTKTILSLGFVDRP